MATSVKTTTSVQETVYRALRKSIINLNLLPGKAISENEISQRYNVSRTPVREAFIHLSQEGLLRIIPQKETQVSRIDIERVAQEFFLRESLELSVLEPFIASAQEGDFNTLGAIIERQRISLEHENYVDFISEDNDFHHLLFTVAGQELSWQVIETMGGHYHRIRLLSVWLSGIGNSILMEHQRIHSALRKRSLEAVEKLMGEHLHRLDHEEDVMRQKFPDYFSTPQERGGFEVDFGGLPLASKKN